MNKWINGYTKIMAMMWDNGWIGFFSYMYIVSLVVIAGTLEQPGFPWFHTLAGGLIVLPAMFSDGGKA